MTCLSIQPGGTGIDVSVLVSSDTRLLVQGITGRQASWSVDDIRRYGTTVVAGVVPGRGGTVYGGDIPVFDFVADAVAETGANASLVYVPASTACEAVLEAIECGLALVVYPGDGLPQADAIRLRGAAQERGVTFIGPNTPGLISPGLAKLGFMPSDCYMPGRVGVISRSGSLSYEVCFRLSSAAIGQSTVIGIGGDPVRGLSMVEAYELLAADDDTDAIVVLGEIGGFEEQSLAASFERDSGKPTVAFIVGRTALPGKRLGHAGALIGGADEGYEAKALALASVGVRVVHTIDELVPAVQAATAGGSALARSAR